MTLFPEPEEARARLARELAKPEYHESLLERFTRWFGDLLDGVRSASETVGGLNPVVALLVLGVLALVIALALGRLSTSPAPPGRGRALFVAAPEDAAVHRVRASRALDRQAWDEAVVEAMRALAAGLFERGLVAERAGVTAHEVAGLAGELFPGSRQRLRDLADVFDQTRYGDRATDAAAAREAVALELEIDRTAPTRAPSHGPRSAVPR